MLQVQFLSICCYKPCYRYVICRHAATHQLGQLQVLMRVEQEQKVTEDARICAEQDAASQKYAAHVLQVNSV